MCVDGVLSFLVSLFDEEDKGPEKRSFEGSFNGLNLSELLLGDKEQSINRLQVYKVNSR